MIRNSGSRRCSLDIIANSFLEIWFGSAKGNKRMCIFTSSNCWRTRPVKSLTKWQFLKAVAILSFSNYLLMTLDLILTLTLKVIWEERAILLTKTSLIIFEFWHWMLIVKIRCGNELEVYFERRLKVKSIIFNKNRIFLTAEMGETQNWVIWLILKSYSECLRSRIIVETVVYIQRQKTLKLNLCSYENKNFCVKSSYNIEELADISSTL